MDVPPRHPGGAGGLDHDVGPRRWAGDEHVRLQQSGDEPLHGFHRVALGALREPAELGAPRAGEHDELETVSGEGGELVGEQQVVVRADAIDQRDLAARHSLVEERAQRSDPDPGGEHRDESVPPVDRGE